MLDESQDPATPGLGSEASIPSKFKSPEELGKAYTELEKLTYSQTQRMADLETKLAQFEQMQQQAATPREDNRSFTDLYPGQQQLDKRETELASRLLTKPSEVLRQHAEWVRSESRKEFQQELQAQRAIDRFQIENPDLARHEDIVGIYVRRQPENLSPAERLKRAAPEARKYLAEIAKGNNQPSQSLDPQTYVESPTSHPAPAAASQPAPQEDELSEMIRERSAIQAKKRL